MALLIAICGAVGIVSYASMDAFLTRQLDDQLSQAANLARATRAARPLAASTDGDPRHARGQRIGTPNASIRNSQVSSGGFLASDTTRQPLSTEDKETLLALDANSRPWTVPMSSGDYRLIAVQTSSGDILVNGTPPGRQGKDPQVLVLWTLLVFVSLGGLPADRPGGDGS